MTVPLVRAMANTLLDHDIDPLDAAAVVGALVIAGFSVQDIHQHYDDVVLMAMIRRRNDARRAG